MEDKDYLKREKKYSEKKIVSEMHLTNSKVQMSSLSFKYVCVLKPGQKWNKHLASPVHTEYCTKIVAEYNFKY